MPPRQCSASAQKNAIGFKQKTSWLRVCKESSGDLPPSELWKSACHLRPKPLSSVREGWGVYVAPLCQWSVLGAWWACISLPPSLPPSLLLLFRPQVKSESVKVLLAQSCPTVCDSMGYSPPGSSVHGILQARILQWVAISFSRGSSQPRERTQVSCTAGRLFTIWTTGNTRSREPSLIPLGLSQVLALTTSGPDHGCQRSCNASMSVSRQGRARSGVSRTPSTHLVHWTSGNLYLYIDI